MSEAGRSPDGASEAGGELLYVSWGGTGRAASARQAILRAKADGRAIRYLAVLDDEHFADLDPRMRELVADELDWLLDAQLELTREQVGASDVAVTVEVRTGQVVDLVVETIEAIGVTPVLIGAPVPVAGHETIDALMAVIGERTGCPVELVRPA